VTLSNVFEVAPEEVDRMVRDIRAVAQEHVERYARPDERDEVSQRIDPETAIVFGRWSWSNPYDPDTPQNGGDDCVSRVYYAVDPDDGIAVLLAHLPDDTREKIRRETS
jgi:hypothetical protein